jgi:Bacterial dnaA protein helix-turn-helix
MTYLQEQHAAHKARIARLGILPPSRWTRPVQTAEVVPPAAIAEPEESPPEQERDWLIMATPQRDFAKFPLLITEIQRLVAKRYKVKRADILSARRTADVTLPRQIAMYLARTMTLRATTEIGRRFGNRDHTTVLHAVQKIERMRARDPEFDAQIRALESAKEA